ncbi:putative cell wall protein [Rhypophila decipiens]|uniref:Cell wall protein n=1 Tax=Rhypophila decipiens TaxID=261697 RepID=A0AAN6YKH1_9PEZI|nr:putative cell wall protein [Rhypophila decipiens]
MFVKHLIPVLAAIGSAAAQCKGTATINSQADADGIARSCKTYSGDIVIGKQTDSKIDISGISKITGDLTVLNNGQILDLTSSDLGEIGGTFTLQNLTLLTSLTLPSLEKVDTLLFQALPALATLTIGPPGITEAKSVTITDTFLESLAGINVQNVETLDVNNNRRLSDFSSSIKTVSKVLKVSANNREMTLTLPNLAWAANLEIANVTTFSVPSLAAVNGSARFDSNFFEKFSAPNLTKTDDDVSFVGNSKLAEIDFSSLTIIGGGLLIANNTALKEIKDFQKLKTVGGALKMRGNFTKIELPSLNDVKGAFDISSTTDIKDDCDVFQKLSRTGGGGQIQGTFKCESDNEKANEDTGSGTSGGGSSSDKKDSAAGVVFNTALFALSAFAGVSMLL